VHAYTFREEDVFRFPGLDVEAELDMLYKRLRLDGLISDSIAPLTSYLKRASTEHKWNLDIANRPARRPCP